MENPSSPTTSMSKGASVLAEPEKAFDLPALQQLFAGLFETDCAPRFFKAPGRVNLIGEHTDYNDGFVLPMAIEWGTLIVATPRSDRTIQVHSISRSQGDIFSLDTPEAAEKSSWRNYVRGVAYSLEEAGWQLKGANLLIDSNVPSGAGLSSSAALENAVAYTLLKLSGYDEIDRIKMALAGQAAEHRYVGTQCGIMDQFISALGIEDHALLIDCQSLTPTPIPMQLGNHALVVCDSGVKHNLASSAYNQRRQECRTGVEFLSSVLPGLQSLREVSLTQLEEYAAIIPDPIIRQRVHHVVSENDRTLRAAEALRLGNIPQLGELMGASHASLRDDYQVSCDELDVLVSTAFTIPGVLGARMTGGGFGGCTINLVANDAIGSFKQTLSEAYHQHFSRVPRFFTTRASQGVHEIF